MRRISVRRQQQDNQNNKRWSTALIDNNDQEEQISTASQSPYLTLITNKLGIPRERAERACVATGFRSVQAAIDWLVKRHDPDKATRTEFLLLLCPDVRLNEQIRTNTQETFRQLRREISGRDRSHLRAFQLSSFFHIPDRYVDTLHRVFDSVVDQYRNSFKQLIRVLLHSTSDSLMLVHDTASKKIVDDLFLAFKEQCEQSIPNVSVTPGKKLAHLTLVHGLASVFHLTLDQRSSLIQLARLCIDFDRSIKWSLRLYSREQPSASEVAYRVVSPIKEPSINNSPLLKANDLFMVLDNGRLSAQENVYGE